MPSLTISRSAEPPECRRTLAAADGSFYDYWPAPTGLDIGLRDRGSMAALAAVWPDLLIVEELADRGNITRGQSSGAT